MEITESSAIVGLHANILLLLGIAVFLGAVGGRVFQRLKIPQVVGFIFIGLIPKSVVDPKSLSELVGFLDRQVLDEKISREMLRRKHISTA